MSVTKTIFFQSFEQHFTASLCGRSLLHLNVDLQTHEKINSTEEIWDASQISGKSCGDWFKALQSKTALLLCVFSAAAPSLPSRPVITPELIGQSVHLRCSFVPPPWSQPLGFQVVWARHIGHSMKAEIRQESTLKPFALAEMDGVHFRLGETVIPARLCWESREHMWRVWPPQAGQHKLRITLNSSCRGSDLHSKGRGATSVLSS